ncbi:MAG: flavodoxin family protein [Planctomycetota bacterium]
MNILGINGSGRPGGNTGVLVDAILDGAAEAGAAAERGDLAGWALRGCTACKACKDSHRCVIDDHMQRFYDIAPTTDVLVLASPIYLDHITAQLMTFIQRTYCYLGRRLENHYPNTRTRIVTAITYGAGDPHAYDDVTAWIRDRMKGYYGLETVGTFTLPGARHDDVVGDDHPEIKRARAFGTTLAEG